MTDGDCLICRKHRGELLPPGGPLVDDELWYACHAFDLERTGDPHYLGHVIVEPKRHIPGLPEVDEEEVRGLGPLLPGLARAIKQACEAEHVYCAVIGHHVAHLHVHLFPRYPHTPPEYWFMRVDEAPNAPKGGPDEIAQVTARIRSQLRF